MLQVTWVSNLFSSIGNNSVFSSPADFSKPVVWLHHFLSHLPTPVRHWWPSCYTSLHFPMTRTQRLYISTCASVFLFTTELTTLHLYKPTYYSVTCLRPQALSLPTRVPSTSRWWCHVTEAPEPEILWFRVTIKIYIIPEQFHILCFAPFVKMSRLSINRT